MKKFIAIAVSVLISGIFSEDVGRDVKQDTETWAVITADDSRSTDEKDYLGELSAAIARPEPFGTELTADKENYALHKDARYHFEQLFFASFAEANEADIEKWITDDAAFDEFIKYGWDINSAVCATNGEDLDPESEVNAAFIKAAQLDYKRNINTKTGMLDADTYAGVIAISDDGDDTTCAYIAVVYNKESGMKIYTFEYDAYADAYFPCFIGSWDRGNYSITMEKESAETPQAFLEFIKQIRESE